MLRLNHLSSTFVRAQPSIIIWQKNRRLATTRLYRQESAAQQSPIEQPPTHQVEILNDSKQKQEAEQTSNQAENSSQQPDRTKITLEEQNRTSATSKPQSNDGNKPQKHIPRENVIAQPKKGSKQEQNPNRRLPRPGALILNRRCTQNKIPQAKGPRRVRRRVPNNPGAARDSPDKYASYHEQLWNRSSIDLGEYIDIVKNAKTEVDPVIKAWIQLLKKSESFGKRGALIKETPVLKSTPDLNTTSNQDQERTLSTVGSSPDDTSTHLSNSPCSHSDQAPLEQDTLKVEITQDSSSSQDAPLNKSSPEGTSSDHVSHQTVKTSRAKAKTAKNLESINNPSSIRIETIDPSKLEFTALEESDVEKVPFLQYDLDRVLFQCGVQQMQDERTGVFNFDPYLATIMPTNEFDFDALKEYVTSSKDDKLRGLASNHGTKYCGSTSSMTAILSHFHYLISAWRLPNFGHVSRSVSLENENFTIITRAPAAAYLAYKDGVYAIDADKQFDTENVLSMLGKSMEKLLTLPKDDYEKYRRTKSHTLPQELREASETYHYSKMGDLLMRSQLDAKDPRLPGAGIFDLKTRAVVSIRMDVRGYKKGVGYEIRKQFGEWQSFEREYFDMIRAAFLKYSLQVRMGRMDGIFVAFHNTQRIFGFQYYALKDMDWALHGTHDPRLGDQEFLLSLKLLNHLMNIATQRFPGRTLRIHVETRPVRATTLNFFAEPISDEQMHKNQQSCKPLVEQLENEIRGLTPNKYETQGQPKNSEDKKSTKQPDSGGSVTDQESFERAMEAALQSAQAKEGKGGKMDEDDVSELLGLSVSLRNHVNGSFVRRPVIEDEDSPFNWKIQYVVNELSDDEAQTLYKATKKRRRTVFTKTPDEASRAWQKMFKGQLRLMTEEGTRHRKRMTQLYQNEAVRVAWNMDPLPKS
ncbi:hypothetical protein CDD82_4010 [Ophiocordyceps australis]|uniref:Pet127-domain-containing protein n=1 Tax=Ophiocordyceps australis TaxID=1399860 RepID=A0A2C5ZLX5_9HYPO|nr:hypothetical protein CDD82_4010 [Ophiocordyceps australis]